VLDLRLSQLRHFLLIVETRSFRAASRRAFRSQPALSQSIRQLESRLGQPLFEKRSRTTLTPFGASCLPLIREMVAHIERSTASMLHVAQRSGGRVAIAILPSVATQWLPSLLKTFVHAHPGVEVKVLAEDSRNVHRLVAQGEVDFGVSSLHEPDPNLQFMPLIEDRFGLLCRSDHPLAASPRALPWDALRGQPILGNVMHPQLADTRAWDFVAQPEIYVTNLPTLLALVENGLGVTAIPALACPRNLGSLAFIPLARPTRARTIGIMALAGRSLLPAADAMIALLKAHLKEEQLTVGEKTGVLRTMVKLARDVRGGNPSRVAAGGNGFASSRRQEKGRVSKRGTPRDRTW
jgi:DNA-binding transcriptional LysR family regulator